MEPREDQQKDTEEHMPSMSDMDVNLPTLERPEKKQDTQTEESAIDDNVTNVAKKVSEVLDAPTEKNSPLSPEERAELRQKVLAGQAELQDVIRRFNSGELAMTSPSDRLALIAYLIAHLKDYHAEDLPDMLLQLVQFADERTRSMLFATLWKSPYLRKRYLYKFFLVDEGLDPHYEKFHRRLVSDIQGLDILALLAQRDVYKPTGEYLLTFEKRLLEYRRYGHEVLTMLIEQKALPLLDEVRGEYESHKQLYDDTRLFRDLLRNPDTTHEKLVEVSHTILNEEYDRNDPMSMALLRLQERDVDSFLFLIENHDLLSPDEIQTVAEGIYFESVDDDNQRVRAYVTDTLGEGGFGRVYRCQYFVNEDTSIRFGAAKLPHTKGFFFDQERENAEVVRSWNSEHLNTALEITKDFIVYESADNVQSLRRAPNELPVRDTLRALIGMIDGVAEYQERKYVHGDLKGENVILFQLEGGWYTQVIDNNPLAVNDGLYRTEKDKPELLKNWAFTPSFSTSAEQDAYIAADAEERFYGIDNQSLLAIYDQDMKDIFQQNLTVEQFSVIDNAFTWFAQGENLYREGALLELQEKLRHAYESLPTS
ncbi:hypothetical protein KC725_01695 [Candidatus Peregrinibacteria bacterium]|nr:hypothetical protein [Candidatus Peregrinibacteria bacterium]